MDSKPEPVDLLKTFVAECGGQKAAALRLGCSPQFVGQLYHGKRSVPPSMLGTIQKRVKRQAKG